MVLVILAAVYCNSVMFTAFNSEGQVESAKAFYAADSGINRVLYYLTYQAPDGTTNGSFRTVTSYPSATGGNYSSCSPGSCYPQTIVWDSIKNYVYTIWVDTSGADVKITSCGSYNNIFITVQVTVTKLGATSTFYPVAGTWNQPKGTSNNCP